MTPDPPCACEGLAEILRWAPPPMCLPSVYLTSLHVSTSPRPFPSIFAYCKQSDTGGGMRLPDVWVYCYSIINWYRHGPQFVRESKWCCLDSNSNC